MRPRSLAMFIVVLAASLCACHASKETAPARTAVAQDAPAVTLGPTSASDGSSPGSTPPAASFTPPASRTATTPPPAADNPLPLAFAQTTPEDGAPRVPITRVKELLAENAAIVVDVRSASAYDFEHARGAINIPEDQLAQRLGELPRDRLIVLYCT